MRTARSPPSVCASAPPRLPFFCRRRGQAAVVGHRKRCMAWTSSPRPAEMANDPPQPRAAALCRQCQRHPRGRVEGQRLPPPRQVPRHGLARRDVTVEDRRNDPFDGLRAVFPRAGYANALCADQPGVSGVASAHRPQTARGASVARMAGDTATPRKGNAADGARGSKPAPKTRGWSSPSGGSVLAFARSACAIPGTPRGLPWHLRPWQSAPAVPGTLPLTLLTELFITVTDADRAPPGGR
jgi:hypothetical protein